MASLWRIDLSHGVSLKKAGGRAKRKSFMALNCSDVIARDVIHKTLPRIFSQKNGKVKNRSDKRRDQYVTKCIYFSIKGFDFCLLE